MQIPRNIIFCVLNSLIWISLGVIEFIGLGKHIDTTSSESVAKQGIMVTLASMFATFWLMICLNPDNLVLHKNIVRIYTLLQASYFIMYFGFSGQWINDDSKISITFSSDINDWSKTKLVLTFIVLLFWAYLGFTVWFSDKYTYSQFGCEMRITQPTPPPPLPTPSRPQPPTSLPPSARSRSSLPLIPPPL